MSAAQGGGAQPGRLSGELADRLRTAGRTGPAVDAAFRAVPRHVFLPETKPAQAYRDVAVVVQWNDDGLPVSASTQPTMMAIMLEQLGLAAGHRVLEIGTGTGYNAAVMAHIVGDQRSVVTIDIVPELIGRARGNLAAAGYEGITVICGDGAAGVPEQAPFDRIIVTAGAWDLAPQWLAQLAPGGRIVLPLSVRGIQLSVGLEAAGDHWASRSACRCSFVRVTGAFTGPEAVIALGPQPGLRARAADGPPPDAGALHEALSGPVATAPTGLRVAGTAQLADLDLWLTLTEPHLTRLNLLGGHAGHASQAQQRIADLMPFGCLAEAGGPAGLGVAAVSAEGSPPRPGPAGIVVQGYGPGGASLAGRLARQAAAWHELGRPGASRLELSVYPQGTPATSIASESIVFDRPHSRLAARWLART